MFLQSLPHSSETSCLPKASSPVCRLCTIFPEAKWPLPVTCENRQTWPGEGKPYVKAWGTQSIFQSEPNYQADFISFLLLFPYNFSKLTCCIFIFTHFKKLSFFFSFSCVVQDPGPLFRDQTHALCSGFLTTGTPGESLSLL